MFKGYYRVGTPPVHMTLGQKSTFCSFWVGQKSLQLPILGVLVYKEGCIWPIIDINPRTNPSRSKLAYNISIFRLNLQFFILRDRPSLAESHVLTKKEPSHECMISLRVCRDAPITNGGYQVRIW